MDVLCPNIVDEKSTVETSRRIRGRNHILERAEQGYMHFGFSSTPVVSSVILPDGYLIISSRAIIGPSFVWHDCFRNCLK